MLIGREVGGCQHHLAQRKREFRQPARGTGRGDHQAIRSSPATRSKCASRLKSGRACWRQSAAIHRSLVGMGLPFFFNSSPIVA